MSEFDHIDTKVAGFNPLSAEEARELYARMVSAKAKLSALSDTLELRWKDNEALEAKLAIACEALEYLASGDDKDLEKLSSHATCVDLLTRKNHARESLAKIKGDSK